MQDILIYAAVVVGVVGITVLFKYLKKKNIINDGDINVVISVVGIAKNIVADLNLNDKFDKNINQALDLADEVSDYVHNLSLVTDVSDKEKLAADVVNEILGKVGYTPSDKDASLIKIAIEESLKFLDSKDQI